jgi:hypothetical protein
VAFWADLDIINVSFCWPFMVAPFAFQNYDWHIQLLLLLLYYIKHINVNHFYASLNDSANKQKASYPMITANQAAC